MTTDYRARMLPWVRICAAAYAGILVYVLLQPFVFIWPFETAANSTEWHSRSGGVALGPSGMLISSKRLVALSRNLKAGRGITIELWLETASIDQEGPARIVSYSLDPWTRNFTVGQKGEHLIVRLRTTGTDYNGMPSVEVAGVFLRRGRQHIVVTYDFSELRVYVDGNVRTKTDFLKGDFSTWNPNYFLIFGNEASGARPWNGVIYYAAIYEQPLSTSTISRRYAAGVPKGGEPILAYDFSQGLNGSIEDRQRAEALQPELRLETPARVAKLAYPLLSFVNGRLTGIRLDAWDIIRNVILFLPFGALGFAFTTSRMRSPTTSVPIIVFSAALFSVTCEVLQVLEVVRTSSVLDVAANVVGALLGAVACRKWFSWIARWPQDAISP